MMSVPLELIIVMLMPFVQTPKAHSHVLANLDTVEMEELALVCMHCFSAYLT